MPRVECISSDEEESVWQHRSQIKRRKITQSSQVSYSSTLRKKQPDDGNNTKDKNSKNSTTKQTQNTVSSLGFSSLPAKKLIAAGIQVKDEVPSCSDDFRPTRVYSQIIEKVATNRGRQSTSSVKQDPDTATRPEKPNNKSNTKTRKRKSDKKKSAVTQATPDNKKWSGRCRNCQFPFSALYGIDTPNWHLKDCLDVPYSSTEQCPSGIRCTSTIASHYKKYRHTALSKSEHKKDAERPASDGAETPDRKGGGAETPDRKREEDMDQFDMNGEDLAFGSQNEDTGDVHNAKMKLEFDDTCRPEHKQSLAISGVINIDSDSPGHGDVECSPESSNRLTNLKERTDKLKRRSVLTLMKQSIKQPSNLASKKSLDNGGLYTATTCRNSFSSETNEDIKSVPFFSSTLDENTCKDKKFPRLSSTLDENTDIKSHKYLKHDPDKAHKYMKYDPDAVITRIDPVDLVNSDSSNSVQDINNITDSMQDINDIKDRSIQDMLNDVFDDKQHDDHDDDDGIDDEIADEGDDVGVDHDSIDDDGDDYKAQHHGHDKGDGSCDNDAAADDDDDNDSGGDDARDYVGDDHHHQHNNYHHHHDGGDVDDDYHGGNDDDDESEHGGNDYGNGNVGDNKDGGDDIMETNQQDESSNDSDLVQTCMSSLFKPAQSKSKDNNCNDNKVNNLNRDSVRTSKDIPNVNFAIGPSEFVKTARKSKVPPVATTVSRYSTPIKLYSDDNSCSRDSAKGFFARKLEEKKQNFISDDNSCSRDSDKGYFAKKREEKKQNFISDDDSCSRDSAKGLFARKLGEKKQNINQPNNYNKQEHKDKLTSCTETTSHTFGNKDQAETDISAGKQKIQEKSEMLDSVKKCSVKNHESSMKTCDSDLAADNCKEKISKQNTLKSNSKTNTQSKGKSLKSQKSIQKLTEIKSKTHQPGKKTRKKPEVQRELHALGLGGWGKIVVETDDSSDNETTDRPTGNTSQTSNKHSDFVSTKTTAIKLMHEEFARDHNSGDTKGHNGKDKGQTTNQMCQVKFDTEISSCEKRTLDKSFGKGSAERKGGENGLTLEKSPKVINLTPKFHIDDVRSIGDDEDMAGGFFKEEDNEAVSNDECVMMDNMSECEEEGAAHESDIFTDNDDNNTRVNEHEVSGSSDQTVPSFDEPEVPDINMPPLNSGSDTDDTARVLDNIASKVQEIQKNALQILMQASKALNSKNKHKPAKKNNTVPSSTSSSRNVNEFLMSNRNKGEPNKGVPPSSKPNIRSTPVSHAAGTHKQEEENEPNTSYQRKCPFYKKIPGTSLTVDAFRYGSIPDCKAYILSHFHYDHYGGLKKAFAHPLYCSKITGNLVMKKIGVRSEYIHTVALNTPTIVENVEITFLEANHCPGAVLILFKLRSGQVFLHSGDFRACRDMEDYTELQGLKIHYLYLDTTYCDPQYDFPNQNDVVRYAVKLARDAVACNQGTLIVCGTYTIGKERIFRGIAEELDCRVCVTRDKKSVLDCLEDPWLQSRVSLKWEDSRLHVLPMAKLNYQGLKEHLQKNGSKYTCVLGIKPTGWTYNKKLIGLDHIKPELNRDGIKIYGLPYSEHSSYLEMKRFVQFTKPDKILPTVNNGNFHSRKKMEAIFAAWMEEIRQRPTNTQVQPSVSKWTK